jgi:hypothetical protein
MDGHVQSRLSTGTSFITVVLLLAGLVAGAFGRAVGHEFVWDDFIFVTDKAAYRDHDFKTILFSLSANGLEYLPVRDLTYVLDFALWGRNPAGFHFSNLVYYFFTMLAVYLFATQLATILPKDAPSGTAVDGRVVGVLTATLFAVHPVNSEVVNFVTCRNALVSGMFFFLACQAYLVHLGDPKFHKRAWHVAAIACFVMALFSKATAIALPLILLLVNALVSPWRNTRRWLGLVPFALVSGAGFFFFRAVALRTHTISIDQSPGVSSFGSSVAVAAQVPLFYLTKLLVPRSFSADYGSEQFASHLVDWRVLVGLSVIIEIGRASCRERVS